MADSADDFGERAATEEEIEGWVTLVRSARTATRGFRPRLGSPDRMRPNPDSNRASSEGDPE